MTVMVLVHGAWTGPHVWGPVHGLLRADGHDVFAPALTGLGEGANLARPDTDLTTHVRDVLGVLRQEALDDVVLVGHSYGGVVAQLVADRVPHHVAHVVLLDSLLARDGRSFADLGRHPVPDGAEWIAPPRLRHTDPARLARLLPAARLALQPAQTFLEPMSLAAPLEGRPFGLTYVRASLRSPSVPYERAAAYAREHPAWNYQEIDCDHDTMTSRPEELSALLRAVTAEADTARGDLRPR